MKPRRIYQSVDHFSNSNNLIFKISNELKQKYKNVFIAAKYSDNELMNDVKNALLTEHVPLIFDEAFHPVEINILNIIRNKFPEHKILSARIPKRQIRKNEILNEDLEYERLKEEEIREKQMERRRNELEKLKQKSNQRKADLKKLLNKKNRSINKKKPKEEEDPRYKQHNLIDEYKNKIKHDVQGKIFKYDDEKYKIEQKRLKEEKREKCLEIQNFLDAQINEKQNRKIDEIKLNNLYMDEEFKDYMKWRDNEYEKYMNQRKKYRDYQVDLAQCLREKEERKKNEKLEVKKINSAFRQQFNTNAEDEVEKILNKQKVRKNFSSDFQNDLSFNNSENNTNVEVNKIEVNNTINSSITNNNYNTINISENSNNNINLNDNLNNNNNYNLYDNLNNNNNKDNAEKKNYIENDVIKQRVLQRIQDQQNAAKYLKQIYDSHEKNMNERYNKFIMGNDTTETDKKKELEIADKKRQEKLEDLKKFMKEDIQKKLLDNQKKKEEDLKYRMYLNKSYNEYLNEKNGRRKKQLEQYEQYRKELEAQIQEKQIRGREQLKYTEII